MTATPVNGKGDPKGPPEGTQRGPKRGGVRLQGVIVYINDLDPQWRT
jgi:hypothetical protein